MSRAPHRTVKLPSGWWERIEDWLQVRKISELEFCDSEPPISARTLARARAREDRAVTAKVAKRLATKLKIPTVAQLLVFLDSPHDNRPPKSLSQTESAGLNAHYLAIVRAGLFVDAVDLAEDAASRARVSNAPHLVVHWLDRAAWASCWIGALSEAAAYYAEAITLIKNAIAADPSNTNLEFLYLRARFGQIMTEDRFQESKFKPAFGQNKILLDELDKIWPNLQGEVATDATLLRANIRHQQGDMLRNLGQYEESLNLLGVVIDEFPVYAFEERWQAQISLADSLRMNGKLDAATADYNKLERVGIERQELQLVGRILRRRVAILQLKGEFEAADEVLQTLLPLANSIAGRYRFVQIYALLAKGSGRTVDINEAKEALVEAQSFGDLSPSLRAAEYAHLCLCRAEIARTERKLDLAYRLFEEAYRIYHRSQMNWGIVRSAFGMKLTGRQAPSVVFTNEPEGLDAVLLDLFNNGEKLDHGALSLGLP